MIIILSLIVIIILQITITTLLIVINKRFNKIIQNISVNIDECNVYDTREINHSEEE